MNLKTLPIATLCLAIAFVLVVVVGGIKVLDDSLGYVAYSKQVAILAVGLGLLGIGRGLDSEHKP